MRRSGTPKTALITGASSGIGRELAWVFASHGAGVVLVARSEAKLAQLAHELASTFSVQATVLPGDLSDPETPARLFAELGRQDLTVDALVNNAGFGKYGPFAETELSSHVDVLEVNVVALTRLTKLALGPMLERRRGWIMNVASTAAFQPGPLMAVYYASKAYVLHFSEALANELHGTGVTVTTLCPGPTETAFWDRAAAHDSRLSSVGMMSASEVAKVGYRGLMAGKPVVIPGRLNRLLAKGYRVAPRKLGTQIIRRLQEKRHS